MKRRDFIFDSTKAAAGMVIMGSSLVYLSGCTSSDEAYNNLFSVKEVEIMNELGNIFIPPTNNPGAKEAKVGEFIALIVKDCFPEDEQVRFKEELKELNNSTQKYSSKSFLESSRHQRLILVKEKDQNADEGFQRLKSMIVSSYLSSEIGTTKFFDYYPVPGRYDGCTMERPW